MVEPPAIPRATYRIQFRDGFGFADAVAILPYLAELGVSHLYASPIFKARAGSSHGYDAVDLNGIDPVLGGETGFDALSEALHKHGMGLLLDFVPNHMGIGPDNAWWQDVLAKGRQSEFADFFDIDWDAAGGKVVLPFLGAPLPELLAAGEIVLDADAQTGSVGLRYHEHRWPIAAGSLDGLAESEDSPEARLKRISRDPSALAALIERQAYRPVHWRDGPAQLNYRRFFEIDDLVALRMDRDDVFEAAHRLLLRLIGERKVQGVRLDHIDGLLDPLGYCRRLADAAAAALDMPTPTLDDIRAGKPIYLVVEKILGHGEQLPAALMAAGTTGYEFMTALAGLLVDPAAEDELAAIKTAFGGERRPFNDIAAEAKIEVLTASFEGELERLSATLHAFANRQTATADTTLAACREALARVIAAFPVYRTYVNREGATAEDRECIETVIAQASLSGPLPALLQDLLLGRAPEGSGIAPEDALGFAQRVQQLTGPVMAKAVEDRSFYRDLRLVSLNDVGGEPAIVGGTIDDFHQWADEHREHQPASMLATATHDHKRGEDVRARLHVLSEMPDRWRQAALGWKGLNAGLIETVDGRRAPSADGEYLIYQSLLGIWPPTLDPGDQAGLDGLCERLTAFMQKASREAAVRTSWTDVDQAYEDATERFVRALLDPERSPGFLKELADLAADLMRPGMINSLAQTVLKLTLPGVPDIYQGTELWDLSLVDPDNRWPIDVPALAARLQEWKGGPARPADIAGGGLKQALIAALLQLRRSEPALISEGGYLPVAASGAQADRVMAFARHHERGALLVAVPRLMAGRIASDPDPAALRLDWADTRLQLPAALQSAAWTDALAGNGVRIEPGAEIALADVTGPLPLAVLLSR